MKQWMTTRSQQCESDSAIEVHGFSCESRTATLSRVHRVLSSSGCWMVDYKRSSHAMEYRFEIEMSSVLELYCGLVAAGLQMTELTHRMLTQLCVLRRNDRALGSRGRVLNVRLVMTFLKLEEELPAVMAAPAQCC